MVSSTSVGLSPLQREILEAFFERTEKFFLTGCGALAGFYLKHRDTKDLDLFATPDVDIHVGVDALHDGSTAIGAVDKVLRESGDFRRFIVTRGDESTLVDLVVDRAPQIEKDKPRFGRVVVDPVGEIAANKLCALLDRVEVRDLFDLKLLLEGGLQLEQVLRGAQQKYASVDPATLAWVLGGFRLGPAMPFPPGITLEELDAFREALMDRLTRMALPVEPG